MTVGFAFGKVKLIDSTAIKGMSNLIVKAALPALILISLQKPFSRELMDEAFQTLLVAFLFYAGIIVLSYIAVRLLRTPEKQTGVLVFALSFSNCGFIGFPVVTSILGPEALFLTSISNIPFNMLAFSAGILIMGITGARKTGDPLKRSHVPLMKLLNINVISAIVGFLFFLFSITIPRGLAMPIEMLGSLTTPLAMITTGAMLSRNRISAVIGDWRLYAVSVLRLAFWPLVVALVLRLFGVTGNLYYITIIIAGMPAASNTSLIAEVYGGDTDTASSIVFMTTLFSVISIPLMALILR